MTLYYKIIKNCEKNYKNCQSPLAFKGCGLRFRFSFICQGTSTRKQRSDLFGLRVKLPPVLKGIEAIPLVPCPIKDTTSELAGLTPH